MKKINTNSIKKACCYFSRYLNTAAIITIILILIWLGSFIYQYVYQTLTQAEELADLRQQVTEQVLSNEKFEVALKKIKEKTSSPTPGIDMIANPFKQLGSSDNISAHQQTDK